ncbi:MAG: hypothetical protein HC845_06130 [Akkermansiaceae bacterium]|nr:hypothetical protein [Akkermansiaceae bacterium]
MSQLANASPEERQQAMQKWHQENAEAHAAQQQLAIQMGADSRPPLRRPPPEPRIPENATPELRELLTTRHAVMKDRVEMMNQLASASPEERQKAMQQWHEENATRLAAMQSAADKLSQSQQTK